MDIIRPELTEYQKSFLYNNKRFTIVEACTKSGKTFSHLWWIFEQAHHFVKQGQQHWWVAPVFSQTEIAFNRLKRVIAGNNHYKTNQSKRTILTPIGSVISFKSAEKPDNLYGEDVYSCVIDEFTRCRRETWYAIRTTLSATNGTCKMIGNFTGHDSWGHQLAEESKKDGSYQYFKVTSDDAIKAGILEKEEVDQARKDLPHSIFMQLYQAEDTDSQDHLVEKEKVKDLFTNDHVEEKGQTYITADIAMQGADMFVIMVFKGMVLVEAKVIDKADGKRVLDELKKMKNKHNVPQSNIVYDADGLGAYIGGFLSGAKAFKNNSPPTRKEKLSFRNLKTQCYYYLAKNINEGKYRVSAELDVHKQNFIQEISFIRNRNYGKDGKIEVLRKEEVKELIGRSPDLADAFMMREYFNVVKISTLAYKVS